MPAMLEDPTAPARYRTSGAPPYPQPNNPEVPMDITPRQVTLRDRITIATLLPFSTATSVPGRLLAYLGQQFNLEIEKGDTYPMVHSMPLETFATYWFQNFGAIMIQGTVEGDSYVDGVWRMEQEGVKWEELALGSFYIKPNYPGRSSHVCNGGFLVTEAARNKGVGRLMGEGYLEWAPRLGYTYSVFNLVYETNVASCRIWDALGFKRVGRIKGCGNLRSSPDAYVDAIIYGRELGPEAEDYACEERFDKIRYYLKHGKYPNGADRAEKSRLRSAATHYKLVTSAPGQEGEEEAERLMLRDKEVISDPQRQYEIARRVHIEGQHGGINKTTATIAEKFHWVRIKETVSLVIKNCENCKDNTTKAPPLTQSTSKRPDAKPRPPPTTVDSNMVDRLMEFDNRPTPQGQQHLDHRPDPETRNPRQVTSPDSTETRQPASSIGPAPVAHMGYPEMSQYSGIPLDPQIMQQSSQLHHHQQRQRRPPPNQAYPHQPQMPPAGYGHSQASPPHPSPTGDPLYGQRQTHANPHKLPDGAGSSTPVDADCSADAAATHTNDSSTTLGTSIRKSTRSVANGAMAQLHAAANLGSNQMTDNDDGLQRFDGDIDMTDSSLDIVQAQADAQPQSGSSPLIGDDTRLATDRHIRIGDEPMGTR